MEMPATGLGGHSAMTSGLKLGKDHAGRMQGGQGSPPWKHSAVADAGHPYPQPKKDLRRAHTVAQGRDISTRVPPRGAECVRTKSLRRAKNSKEALTQPLNQPKEVDVTPDSFGTGREPRHFTVGNVGNNGKIYLRPVTNSHQRGQPSQLPRSPNVPSLENAHLRPNMAHETGSEVRHSVWSNSQLSELQQVIREETSKPKDTNPTRDTQESEFEDVSLHSPSSIGDEPTSTSPGEFKIVIHRSDSSRPKTAGELPHLPLETTIPHYRLGSPRFSTEGTPILRSSINTKTSTSDNFRSSTFVNRDPERLLAIPNLAPLNKALHPGEDRLSSISSMLSTDKTKSELSRSSGAPSTMVFYKLREPVEPTIFDALATNMDDPSVVRYIHGTREITAANPARIVAQISSESFMDYELVSDFFLTFRSYLSTSNLLSLLLARLEWAINRPQDDGRIIRIRTFAALRHWILNYFVDDFVASHDLRVQFCNRINAMYLVVKAKSEGTNSDLKILVDLKKCWNGRCSLYWDSQEFVPERNPDDIVVPGGAATNRDSRSGRLSEIRSFSPVLPTQNEITFTNEDTQTSVPNCTVAQISPPCSPAHTRQISADSNHEVPISPRSESSIHVLSCSIPTKSPKPSSPLSNGARAPHPVPVTSSRHASPNSTPNPLGPTPTTPTWRRPLHSHKRSGSFSDSLRDDRAPLPLYNLDRGQPLHQSYPPTGSLIRGNLCAPLQPYVDVVSPPSPNLIPPHSQFAIDEPHKDRANRKSSKSDSSDGSQKHGANAPPGVKTIIGSIRRALHNRPVPTNPSQQAGNHQLTSLKGKTSALPLNVAFGSEAYRERRAANEQKSHIRADLLCYEAMEHYQKVVMEGLRKQSSVSADAVLGTGNGKPGLAIHVNTRFSQTSTRESLRQITKEGGSGPVLDDAGLDVPLMSGALQPTDGHIGRLSPGHPEHPSVKERSKSASPARKSVGLSKESRVTIPRSSYHSHAVEDQGTERSPSAERTRAKRVGSMSSVLRKYASYQSGMMRENRHTSTNMTLSTSDDGSSQDTSEKPAARMLRRRPGGDLRKIQNVQDLEPRKQSFDSYSSFPYSTNESVLYMGKDITSVPGNAPERAADDRDTGLQLVEAKSAKYMKPSFEAAVAEFSLIPDADDGGIESTLLKLEGKWEPTSPKSSEEENQQTQGEAENKKRYREEHALESPLSDQGSSTWDSSSAATPGYLPPSHRNRITSQFSRVSAVESEDSYCSIPLLERGLGDDSMKRSNARLTASDATMSPPLFARDAGVDNSQPESSHPSIEMVEETESLKRIPQGQTLPDSSVGDGDNYSDLSSELSAEVIDRDEAVRTPSGPRFTTSPGVTVSDPVGSTQPPTLPPSPPMTTHTHSMSYSYPSKYQAQPLTPDPSPIHKTEPHTTDRKLDMQSNVLLNSELGNSENTSRVPPNYNHIPFILACDSQVLAQQLTLVEKAALSEIDWRDLVDLKWTNYSPYALNWAEYLASEDHKGIDLVVARFNLMVKWVLSEVVLTQDIHERARTISKFIHIAVHARRIHNYSTMLQISMALSSVDCTRLLKTWQLVGHGDKRLLRDMESLIQPVRNFHGLRAEIESVNLQEGCIPFVGLYVHDLTYNAQKPAQIASTREGEPLVNFERYRTSATIVKNLLRLIDASTKYEFEPVNGIIERCLWIAALSDERTQALSKELE
ncbi:Guanine nucleotide exchange factor lte1 [Arachnomyces sp. PD_36]|nr:Guanine nucleotide exchange factor lte1 [Arachnomyces sp. PD_36]